MADVQQILRRLETMVGARQPLEAEWKEIFDFSYPERGSGLESTKSIASETFSKKNRILDDTFADAMRILSSGIVSGTTPANSLWFGLDMGAKAEANENEEDGASLSEEDRWLEDSSNTVFENIHGANFDPCAYEGAIDLVAAGWFVLYIDEAEKGGYQFELWPLAECFVASSKSGGTVDTVYRKATLSVEQVVNKYGINAVSEQVRKAYNDGKFLDDVEVLHAIEPRRMYVPGSRMAKNLPISSCHIEVSTKHELKESGYHEFPCVVPRWMLVPGTAYATGPASKAMGSVRTVNDVKALELANLDVFVGGMWLGVDDGVLNPRTVKVGARKIITAASTESLKDLRPAGDFNVAFVSEEKLQAQIRKTLLADQLQPQDGPAMTATEVHARIQLIRQLLGPIYARLQAEYLKPLIERCFGLAYRAGILGTAPASLQGKDFLVRYVSPLARAQRMEEVTAIDQYIVGAANVAQLHPEVLDTIDFDEAQKVRAEALGVPSKVIPTAAAIRKKRQDRADQQQAQQQQAAQAEAMKAAAPQLAAKVA